MISRFDGMTGSKDATYLHLEFAGTPQRAQALLALWPPRARTAMGISAGAHCLAAALYSSLLCWWHLHNATAAVVGASSLGDRRVAAASNAASALCIPMGFLYLGCHVCIAKTLLREDYELALLESNGPIDWLGAIRSGLRRQSQMPATSTLQRARSALADLGPGLGDVALRLLLPTRGA